MREYVKTVSSRTNARNPIFLACVLSTTQQDHFPLDKLIINRFTEYMPNLDEIISSNLAKYQDILELSFSRFLSERGASGKTQKNYCSDINHFLGWTVLTIQSHNIPLPATHTELISLITPHIVEQYQHFLLANRIPTATINRRLSALRTFGAFCQSQGWWSDNPTNILINVPMEKQITDPMAELLITFCADLAREGASKVTIKNYSSDIRQFLHWVETQKTFAF